MTNRKYFSHLSSKISRMHLSFPKAFPDLMHLFDKHHLSPAASDTHTLRNQLRPVALVMSRALSGTHTKWLHTFHGKSRPRSALNLTLARITPIFQLCVRRAEVNVSTRWFHANIIAIRCNLGRAEAEYSSSLILRSRLWPKSLLEGPRVPL